MASSRDVFLNVYDIASPQDPTLISNINNWLVVGGLGVFHSGVEIAGVEYCFGGHPDSSSGVFQVSPRCAPDAVFREAIHMGQTALDRRDVAALLRTFIDAWPGNSYDLLDRNCNAFASDLCVALVGQPIPAWVNRLAYLGSRARWLLPKELDGATAAPVTAAAAAAAAGTPGATPTPSSTSRATANANTNANTNADAEPLLTLEERVKAVEARAVAAEVRAAAAAAGIDATSGEDVVHDSCGRLET
jgi:deubiquitinase DESI2